MLISSISENYAPSKQGTEAEAKAGEGQASMTVDTTAMEEASISRN